MSGVESSQFGVVVIRHRDRNNETGHHTLPCNHTDNGECQWANEGLNFRQRSAHDSSYQKQYEKQCNTTHLHLSHLHSPASATFSAC